MKLTVILGNNAEESFDIQLYSNPFVKKWVSELAWCLENCDINQTEAFAGFLTLDESAEILLQACNTINQYLKGFIEIKDDIKTQPQEYFNYLHLKFEQLNGSFDRPTRLFSIANAELKDAIRNLNFYVHRTESRKQLAKEFYLSFNKDQYRRKPLDDSDYKFFEFKLPPGSLFLHYVELGKDFADLYADNLPIDYENFRNLHFYSGEAFLKINDEDVFKDVGFLNWLKSNNIDPYDKTLGHGKIPLGVVDDPDEVCNKLQKHRYIKQIIIKE